MKKPSQKAKSKKSARRRKKNASVKKSVKKKEFRRPEQRVPQEKQPPVEVTSKAVQKTPKKAKEPKTVAVAGIAGKVGLFLREAKMELKKVKWPTRKELIASTAVVIVITLLVAFYLGLVDFGLIKIIRNVVG